MAFYIAKNLASLWSYRSMLRCVTRLLMLAGGATLFLLLTGCQEHFVGILNPKGIIALKERKLIMDTLALMLIVVLPVIVMSITFLYHYQVSHKTRDYKPNWSHSYLLESIWWGIPCVIIAILAVMTWKKTYELDPYKPIDGLAPPMVIQAIALPWKWLFIYPEQNIATINYLRVPVGAQIEFWTTTDNTPMSAFFVPQLGSQIYAMAGMRTRLHLQGTEIGTYKGMNSQYTGDGFSDMHFKVDVVESAQMDQWVAEVKKSSTTLDEKTYSQLLVPSVGDAPQYFSGVMPDLFDGVLHTYMHTYGKTHPRDNIAKMHKE